MVQVIIQLSDQLAARVQPLQQWLPTVLELGLVDFQTAAVQTASEMIQFLATEPLPQRVLEYHVSERAQRRLRRLLALNGIGNLSDEELRELDELQQIEHIVIMLKAQAAEQIRKAN
jgi:hypothetical protein